MAQVLFKPASVEISVEPGSRLIDVSDRHPEAKVPYSCRSASCGTCRVRVLEGMDALSVAEDDELEVLEAFGSEDNVRLCCQLKLVQFSDRVVLEVVDPE